MAALLERVAGVGDELAHKHLLVAVQGVGDDVQEASRLCLERVRLLARGGGVCGEGTRGAESGHRNASARADENVPRARARDGTRDDGGDGGGAPSGIRSRGIRERDARGGRDGRGGAKGRRQCVCARGEARARDIVFRNTRGARKRGVRRRSGARANLPRVSFPDASAGTRVSTCRQMASSAKIWWEGCGFGLRPSGRGRFANTHTLHSHIFQTRVVQPRLSIDDGVGRFLPMVRPTTLRVGGGWGVVGVIRRDVRLACRRNIRARRRSVHPSVVARRASD